MAFDGITIAAMVSELNKNLSGGRINKIAQPESDELLITGKGANGQKRLLLSASRVALASPLRRGMATWDASSVWATSLKSASGWTFR